MGQNQPIDGNNGSSSQEASLQPSPAVVASSSHAERHVLPRRFLGPMPEVIANSEEVEERHRYLMRLRHKAMKRLRGSADSDWSATSEEGNGASGSSGSRGPGPRILRIRARRKTARGKDVLEEYEVQANSDEDGDDWLGSDEDEDNDGEGARRSHAGVRRFRLALPKGRNKKEKKKRKDVWVGESFDIGREFLAVKKTESIPEEPVLGDGDGPIVDEPREMGQDGDASILTRPSAGSRTTTQESFVTARTEFSARSRPEAWEEHSLAAEDAEGSYRRGSANSSTYPPYDGSSTGQLIHPDPDEASRSVPADWKPPNAPPSASASKPKQKLKQRFLKSALRKGSVTSAQPGLTITPELSQTTLPDARDLPKAKTVQFPVDLDDRSKRSSSRTPRTGDESPADPSEVLNRQGDEAAGTSHEVTADAEAEADDDGDEPDFLPGQIIMRDRMLVRVGYHREEGFRKYDELEYRKSPCSRLEAAEEYNVVWRKGQVEFYQDWGNPIRQRFEHHQRLCFVVPLLAARSSLCVFNDTDMTLCLTTSAGKLGAEVERIMAGPTRRTTTIKNRVAQSKQLQWLRQGHRGTHIFIMKVAERSRAADWYWELWRELGGELPRRIDIHVPSLSTSVRLLVPDCEDMVGGKQAREQLNPDTVISTCWSMLNEAMDLDDLMSQRVGNGSGPDLELAWRTEDGRLDWIAWDTTVQGRKRDWALLVGMAKMQTERRASVLQLRRANHRVRGLHLEDGSALDEPPGVEGYLTRHRGSSAKESIYVATHDGHVFISSMNHANPPITPKKEASTPAELFPEVHSTFIETEHRRMALFIEQCSGGIDFRSIVDIQRCETDVADDLTPRAAGTVDQDGARKPAGSPMQRSFEVTLSNGKVDRFETHSPEIAQEWVDRLYSLRQYWKRRQRIDARMRMDAIGHHVGDDPFALDVVHEDADESLGDIWDWCTIQGCRPNTACGKLYLRKSQWSKFRSRMIFLTGGCLATFKVKAKNPFQERKKVYPLFGAYVYSGMLAGFDVNEANNQDMFDARGRVYQDGLQSSDGSEDTTFCVRLGAKPSTWGKTRSQPWESKGIGHIAPIPLSTKPPGILVFRARSKLERDRWVWAINIEMERQVRSHITEEEIQRNYGTIPDR